MSAYFLDIIAVTYKQDACLRGFIASFQAQTSPGWKMLVIHDGPDATFQTIMSTYKGDPRICWISTDKRYNDWGHSLRARGIEKLGDSKYTLITNADNYYVPIFIEELCSGDADLVYCDMVHNHIKYRQYLNSRLRRGSIDCGAVVVKTNLVKGIGWNSRMYAADWVFIKEAIDRGATTQKVEKTLFVHN